MLLRILFLSIFLSPIADAREKGKGLLHRISSFFGRKKNEKVFKNPDGSPIPRAIPVGEYQDFSEGTYSGFESAWSPKDEEAFAKWIATIGESGCKTASDCLNSAANTLRRPGETISFSSDIDCGRFPFLLRGYFAEKYGLPFTMATDVEPLGPLSDVPDPIRYTPAGNRVSERRWMVSQQDDRSERLRRAVSQTNTKVYRVPIDHDDSDFYSVKPSWKGVRPGTIYYDPEGHVGIVYKVDDRGVIHLMDAQPGSSIARKTFNRSNYVWDNNPKSGGGFKNFRPIVIDQGRYRLAKNSEIPDYSTEQHSHTRKNYHEFIDARVGKSDDPTYEFYLSLKDLCEVFSVRVKNVEKARLAGLPDINIPNGRLPGNIYGGTDDWEMHSTPSADLRIKLTAMRLAEMTDEHRGYRKQFEQEYQKFANWEGCKFQYTNSAGSKVALGLDDVMERAFDFSFDPYHCPELRMGAPKGSAELKSCNSSTEKFEWYEAQQTLRNRTEKNVQLQTGYTLEELKLKAESLGPTKRAKTKPNFSTLL